MTRSVIHLALHLLVPAVVAGVFYRKQFLRAWAVMCATMLVDVDHFLADPLYDPSRCRNPAYHTLQRLFKINNQILLRYKNVMGLKKIILKN